MANSDTKILKKAILSLTNVRLKYSQIHKLRGYIGDLFKEYDLIHNHDPETGKNIYRYPLIQFKIIENIPVILAITDDAIKVFVEIFMKLDEINIEGTNIPIYEKDLKIENVEFGFSNETVTYEFLSPWIALNQKNHSKYINENKENQNELLKRMLIGNILSLCKYLGLWLDESQKIKTEINLKHKTVTLKGEKMTAFMGVFKVNFIIPDLFGVGKSVSRGFGVLRRLV